MNYNEKLKELTEKFILEMESLKSKNQLLKIEKEKDSARYEETFKLSEDKHNQVKWDPKWTILSQPGTKADGPNCRPIWSRDTDDIFLGKSWSWSEFESEIDARIRKISRIIESKT